MTCTRPLVLGSTMMVLSVACATKRTSSSSSASLKLTVQVCSANTGSDHGTLTVSRAIDKNIGFRTRRLFPRKFTVTPTCWVLLRGRPILQRDIDDKILAAATNGQRRFGGGAHLVVQLQGFLRIIHRHAVDGGDHIVGQQTHGRESFRIAAGADAKTILLHRYLDEIGEAHRVLIQLLAIAGDGGGHGAVAAQIL